MDIMSQSERSARMARRRSKNTAPEMLARSLVHAMGYRYRLHAPDLPGRPDLVFRSRKKVIFVHGCFWHLHRACKNCRPPKSRLEYWEPKLQRNSTRDKEVRHALRRLGWRVLVLWECQLGNTDAIRRRVEQFLAL
ncbi:MAG: DNA mismatch endonuclease Vsr [Bryobacteraceae bacterium]|nr:DNA mismatch endonuclease Vsr [Solibacteraceae bacterium]MCL4843551.1 DNA mismatch endonuclease Vsr [Bryobacteraceae bacterium]